MMLSFRLPVSRARKQRFPRSERRKAPVGNPNIKDDDFIEDEQSYFCTPNKRPHISPRSERSPPPTPPSRPQIRNKKESDDRPSQYSSAPRLDKRARDEHNEQERSRRRELAVIYELIRSSFSQDDLRHLEPGSAPKSIEKLSYPQVLQIAHSIMLEETHHIKLFDRTIQDIQFLEKELSKTGVNLPPRPNCPLLTDNYRKVISTVETILRTDKNARNANGVYEMTPSDRASYGDQQLSFVRSRHQHAISDNSELFSPSDKRMHQTPARRHSTISRYNSLSHSHHHSSSYQTSRHSVPSSRSLRPSLGQNQSGAYSQTSASNGSAASLEDLEDLDLNSISETCELFQNPLDEPIEFDPVDTTFGLLPDL